MSNPKIKSEAQRALTNIKSYNLKVFALTVNLGTNLADIEDNGKKKETKENVLLDDVKDKPDDLYSCLKIIQNSASECSVLLISDTTQSNDLLRMVAYSCNPILKASEWLEAAAKNIPGNVIHLPLTSDNESNYDLAEVNVKLLNGSTAIKEKDNALSACFAFLRSKGLSEESDEEDEHTFTLAEYE